jgi:dienelactone hydrolase
MKNNRHSFNIWALGLAIACSICSLAAMAQTAPLGEIKGTALVHTAQSAIGVVQGAQVALPASVSGGVFVGAYRDAPKQARARVPVVVFLHGSSGLSLKAIAEWQAWLAGLGVASIAPDSFALPDRVTYKSPISQAAYEQMHALRASEIALALDALQSAPWADTTRLVLAGTSEGAPSVARYGSAQFVGRMLFAWSCEDNYFVQEHRTAVVPNQAVLNIISTVDPFFSSANTWLGNAQAKGHCAEAFKSQAQTSIVLIPGAPHTLLNLPAAKHAVAGYVAQVLKP